MINQNVSIIIDKMGRLLRSAGDDDWANTFEKFSSEIAVGSFDVFHKIKGMYGGMGSLNDVVLHKNGRPLSSENEEFDALRATLYNLCLNKIENAT